MINYIGIGLLRTYRYLMGKCLVCGEDSYGRNWCTYICQAADAADERLFK